MNHVILLLRPLKMKDWLLCGIRSIAVNKMNFASECTLSAAEEKNRGCFWVILWTVRLNWATLQRVRKNNDQLHTTQQPLHSSCTTRDQKMWCHITARCRQVKTHKRLCAAECRISSLQRSIHKAFSWYYITAFSEPEILHKYWKSTEGCSNTNCCLSYYRQITFSQSHRYCTLLCNTMRPRPILGSITVQQSWDYVKDRWLPH